MLIRVLSLMVALVLSSATFGHMKADEKPDYKVERKELSDGLYVLYGRGGNVGFLTGKDGVFMIDDQYAVMSSSIQAAVEEVSDQPIQFLINTHWHGDHTGGNENFAKEGAIIVAHDEVYTRLSQDATRGERKIEAAPEIARPAITYQKQLTFRRNGHTIEVVHYPRSHTDGDSVLFFKEANAVHTGDIFFNGFYPFVDVDSGGSINGLIKTVEDILSRIDGDTVIIPGHGQVTDKKTFQGYLAMLKDVRARIQKVIDSGKSIDDLEELKPTADLDEKWGKGFMKPDRFNKLLYRSLTEK